MPNRREFLKMGAFAGVAVAIPYERLLEALPEAGSLTVAPFGAPLTVPAVLKPTSSTATTDHYRIVMRPADVEILPGTRTRVWAYNGQFPGPTIRARTGRRVVVDQYNELPVDTSTHLHGGNVPANSDGHPNDVIQPGGFKRYIYPNRQPAATLWYHDHAHHQEARNVYMGLAALYLLSDRNEQKLALPSGEYDVPLIIQDRQFAPDGSLIVTPDDPFGLRKTILVNGRPHPFFQVAARRYRLRFLNASNERAYTLRLDSAQPFVQIASDGGLLPHPVTTETIPLGPGERAEAVVDFSRYPVGTPVVLQNIDGAEDETRQVMRFDITRSAVDRSTVPDTLQPLPDPDPPVRERKFVLSFDAVSGQFVINGKPFDPNRIDVQPKLGTTEIWAITNADTQLRIPHTFHTHLVQFQLLDRDGRRPGPEEAGHKDTIRIAPAETIRLSARFGDYTGVYTYHCHLLGHGDNSMMAQMKVEPALR